MLSNCKIISLLKIIIQEKKNKKAVNILVNLVPYSSHNKDNSYIICMLCINEALY